MPASAHAPNPAPRPKFMQFLSLTHYPTHGFIYTSEPTDLPPPQSVAAAGPGAAAGAGAGNHIPTAAAAGAAGAVAGAPSPIPQPQPQKMQMQTQAQQGIPTTTAPGAPVPTSAPAPAPANPNAALPALTPMIMRTVPLPSYGALFQHFVRACEPMWCHRHTVSVPAGIVYDVGDFRVRMGDVRQTQPVARLRGTVVEIEWRGPSVVQSLTRSAWNSNNGGQQQQQEEEEKEEDGDGSDSGIDLTFSADHYLPDESAIDEEYRSTAQLIREFWARWGIDGAREAILVPDVGREVKEQRRRLREGKGVTRKGHQRKKAAEGTRGWGWGWGDQEEDPDPTAGVDLARQYMEIFRFNR